MQDMDEAEDEDAHHVEGEADEEHEEVAIVPAPCVVTVVQFCRSSQLYVAQYRCSC